MPNLDTSKVHESVKAGKQSNSIRITIPQKHAERLDIEKGDTIKMQAEEGEHIKYASIWNATKQGKDQ